MWYVTWIKFFSENNSAILWKHILRYILLISSTEIGVKFTEYLTVGWNFCLPKDYFRQINLSIMTFICVGRQSRLWINWKVNEMYRTWYKKPLSTTYRLYLLASVFIYQKLISTLVCILEFFIVYTNLIKLQQVIDEAQK